MTDPNMSSNTDVGQKYNEGFRGRCELGERPNGSVHHDLVNPKLVLVERNVYQVDTFTFLLANAGDKVSLNFDGGSIPFTAGVDVTATALAAKAAIDAANVDPQSVYYGFFGTVTPAVGVLTVNHGKYGSHTSSFTATVGTTADYVLTTAGSKAVRARAGRFVAWNPTQGDPALNKARMPASASDRLIGVIRRGPYTMAQTPGPNHYGLVAGESYPQQTMFEAWEKAIVHVETGSDVAGGDPVYVLFSPESRRGVAVNSDGSSAGTSQVNDLVNTASVGDTVAFHFTVSGNVLPTLDVESVSAAADRAALLELVQNSDAYGDLLQQPASIVANKIHLVWLPGLVATFTDDSAGGTADVAEGLTTASTAAIAATAIRKEGATFIEVRTLAQASAYVNLG
jgi:hypothetical protein